MPFFPKSLKSIRPNGGQVHFIQCFVVRKYPLYAVDVEGSPKTIIDRKLIEKNPEKS